MTTDVENAAIVSRWFSAVWAGSRSLSELVALASPTLSSNMRLASSCAEWSPSNSCHEVESSLSGHRL
jgi:hypothetical protein